VFRPIAAVVLSLAAASAAAAAPALPAPLRQAQGRPDQSRGAKRAGAPPPVVNIVHHKLKRSAPGTYQTLEATIVGAYERAKVPRFYWLTCQSTRDSRDILYLNLANSADEFRSLSDAWPGVASSHPDLPRLQQRLAKLIETQSSTLTTRRDDIEYGRTDVDFSTMRALLLTTFHVKAGHEGRFVEAVRRASGSHAPWVLYEANDEPTFVLLAPLKSRAEAARTAPVPRAVRSLKGVYRDMEARVYALMTPMSRVPEAFRRASASSAPPPASPQASRKPRPPSPASSSPSSPRRDSSSTRPSD